MVPSISNRDARTLSKKYKYSKLELYTILSKALKNTPDEYWAKPSKVNPIFDNGHFFNLCVRWVEYKEGINDNDIVHEILVYRVLQGFGKYSEHQVPKKPKKNKPGIVLSEIPSLKLNEKNNK